MAQENTGFTVLSATADTSTAASMWILNEDHVGASILVEVTTAEGSTATKTFTLEGRMPGRDDGTYDVLATSALSSTGTTRLRIHPALSTAANERAQDFLPHEWRVTAAHTGAQNLSYRVDASLYLA